MRFPISQNETAALSAADNKLGRLIKKAGKIERTIVPDPFIALVESIVMQQVSFSAGNAIWKRLVKAANRVTPKNIINLSDDSLRGLGLSRQKAQYVKCIAQAFIDGDVSEDFFKSASPGDIVSRLVKIKGIGYWTAEMFLIFHCAHLDIFSRGDLGLMKGMAWLYDIPVDMPPALCEAIHTRWSPYRTIASLFLWEVTIQSLFSERASTYLYDIQNESDALTYYMSPLGLMEIKTSSKGVDHIRWIDHEGDTSQPSRLGEAVKTQLDEYFSGVRKTFDLPLHMHGTDFQRCVWTALSLIPYGETRSYGHIAGMTGNPNSARAVGMANGKNGLAIVLPCHRIIGADGSLTGYAGGIDRKKWLLNHEARHL